MAGTVTHGYFAIDIYNSLKQDIRNNLKDYKESLKTYNLGHDIYFYSLNIHNRKIKNIGKYMHKHNTKDFFINTIKYIKDNHLENNYEIISYLYGYIGHYALDSTVHPYITYKAGYFNKKKKESYKYNAKHAEFENYIDAYYINKHENMIPNKFKVHKFCFNTKVSDELKKMIDYTMYKTYGFTNMGDAFKRGLINMKVSYKLFRYDPFKIKKSVYKTIDLFTTKKTTKLYPGTYSFNLNNNDYYLNLNHKKWNHPRYKNETYTYSFLDLYNNALKMALDIIDGVNKVLYENAPMKILNELFLDISYSSGKKCDDKMKNKYFEY